MRWTLRARIRRMRFFSRRVSRFAVSDGVVLARVRGGRVGGGAVTGGAAGAVGGGAAGEGASMTPACSLTRRVAPLTTGCSGGTLRSVRDGSLAEGGTGRRRYPTTRLPTRRSVPLPPRDRNLRRPRPVGRAARRH